MNQQTKPSNPESFKYCFNHGDEFFFGGMYDQWNVSLNSYGSINDTLLNHRPEIVNFYRSNEIIDPGKPHHDYILTSYKSYQRAIRDKRYKLIKYSL
jgi:hypothetical protein